ncbi:MBL fold metallo-hydrolase [Candidatus Poribacteria bacterium]|nr:MBL fold metallo-hydrolase [Candidatus Poribacteria bacterium]
MIFKQIPTGFMGNFTYVFGCEKTRRAAVVDPSSDLSEILDFAKENSLKIEWVFATHSHSDHTAGIKELAAKTGAKVAAQKGDAPSLQRGRIPVDKALEDGERIRIGEIEVAVIHTPGHTPGSMCLLTDKKLMTGDTLFIGNCGRSDLPGGDTRQLFDSLHTKLKTLRDDIEVFPGHDYGDRPSSTIGGEKQTNPTLACTTFEEFQEIP